MKNLAYILPVLLWFISCSSEDPKAEQYVIETNYGSFTVKLYNNTPKHRNNFMILASEGYYKNLLFHRVVENFMIQAGDPLSKNAESGQRLGSGGPDYSIKSEINSENFHKQGALAAARKANSENREKRSSGSQFYIVTGKVYTEDELNALEKQINNKRKSQIINYYIDEKLGLRQKLNAFQAAENYEAVDSVLRAVTDEIKNDSIGFKDFEIPEERRKIYTTQGGVPALDGEYTVFGEVTEGMEIVEKIASLPVDENDRPLYDVIISEIRPVKK